MQADARGPPDLEEHLYVNTQGLDAPEPEDSPKKDLFDMRMWAAWGAACCLMGEAQPHPHPYPHSLGDPWFDGGGSALPARSFESTGVGRGSPVCLLSEALSDGGGLDSAFRGANLTGEAHRCDG